MPFRFRSWAIIRWSIVRQLGVIRPIRLTARRCAGCSRCDMRPSRCSRGIPARSSPGSGRSTRGVASASRSRSTGCCSRLIQPPKQRTITGYLAGKRAKHPLKRGSPHEPCQATPSLKGRIRPWGGVSRTPRVPSHENDLR